MYPPKREYERIATGVKVTGIIEKVQYDENHVFKAFKEDEEDTIRPAVRFKFKLDGYNYPHYSRYMKFNVGEKANLYKKYLLILIEDAVPDMNIDLDILNGMAIETVWSDNGDFQNLDSIAPAGAKVKQDVPVSTIDINEPPENNETPF